MEPGKIIQNYRLTRFLGDGGMGQVWLAEHTLLGRKVAVKSLHAQLARNTAIRARFKQEAATLAHLQHPGIVALHDYIEDDAGAYLVMEYVDGTPLDDYIARTSGPIPDAQLRDMFAQILEGFAYAHGQQIVHRDIKPSNFLVTRDGKVKILDFGIAKILSDGERKLTKTGTNLGTVLYMSPEQVQGQAVDQRSDIYSLGVTLFQMATGQSAYPAESTEFFVYDQIVNKPLPSAKSVYPGVTEATEALIQKATQKRAEARFQNCTEFLAALRKSSVRSDLPKTEVDRPVPVVTPAPAMPTPVPPPAAQVPPPPTVPKKASKLPYFVGGGVVILLAILVWQVALKMNSSTSQEDYLRAMMLKDSLYNDSLMQAEADARADQPDEDPGYHADQTKYDGGIENDRSTSSSLGEAENTVRSFYRYLGDEDYAKAYSFTDGKIWGGQYAFSQRNSFGCTDGCTVYSADEVSNDGIMSKVRVDVEISDPCKEKDNIKRYYLELRLKQIYGEWKIFKCSVL